MPRMTGAEAIVKSLRGYDVDTIFGLPGGQLDHLFDAMFKEDGLRVIHTRHEQGAAYMAYGYAKSTGRTGVYTVVPGPGLLNSTAALCTAWSNNAPVLCLSGQIPSRSIGRGYGELHEINDQLGLIRHITKWAERIESPSAAPVLVAEAMRHLTEAGPRPVALEMPMDVMGAEAEVDLGVCGVLVETPDFDPDLIEHAAAILGNARRPMIVIGAGAADAGVELLAVAEALQAPVMAKRNGKGVISAGHYLNANLPMGHALWGEADAVLAIGTRLKMPLTQWGKDDDLSLIRVDIRADEVNRICEPEVGIVGDAAEVLTALHARLGKHNRQRASREDELTTLASTVLQSMHEHAGPQLSYLDTIRQVLPDDGVFVDEVTQVGFVAWYGFPVYKPRQYITAGYQGTLGYGYATALGVAVGNPGKKVVQVSGDGGFMYNVQELSTAAQYGIDLVTIIFNDNAFANVQRQQDEWFEGRRICSDLHNPDFAKLAELFGVAGYRADTPAEVGVVLEKAFSQSGPAIIEVPVGERMPSPWKFIIMEQNRKAICS